MMRKKLYDMWYKMEYPVEPESYRKIAMFALKPETFLAYPPRTQQIELGTRSAQTLKGGEVVSFFQLLTVGPDEYSESVGGEWVKVRGMAIRAKDSQANAILDEMTPEEREPTVWQLSRPLLASVLSRTDEHAFLLPVEIRVYPVPFPFARIQYFMLNALFHAADELDYTKSKHNAMLHENFTQNSIFNEILIDDMSRAEYHAVAKIDPVSYPEVYGPGKYVSIPLKEFVPRVLDLTTPDITAKEQRMNALEQEFESYMRTHPEAPDNYMLVSIILGKSDEYYRLLEEFGGL
jgi:hypothetical protein